MLSLQQKFSLQQKLSPQQIQYQKLLQLNTMALEQRIKTELELNPVLEEVLDEEIEIKETQDDSDDAIDSDDEEYDTADDEFDIEDFMNDENLDNDRLNRSPDEEQTQPVAPQKTTLREQLINQLHMLDLTDDEITIGENIIGSLTKDGYFKEDLGKIIKELKLFEEIDVTLEQGEKVLSIIQTMEPVGIAARDLRECLLLQLRNSSYDPYYSYLAEKILTDHYKEFVNKRYDIIEKEMNLTRETLRSTLDLIHKLNPKPGEGNIDEEESNQITPDFLIEKVDNNYIVTLNDKTMPSLTISQTYLEMIESSKVSENVR